MFKAIACALGLILIIGVSPISYASENYFERPLVQVHIKNAYVRVHVDSNFAKDKGVIIKRMMMQNHEPNFRKMPLVNSSNMITLDKWVSINDEPFKTDFISSIIKFSHDREKKPNVKKGCFKQ